MLISMFHSLRRLLSEMMGIAKKVEKIQDNQEHGVELMSILTIPFINYVFNGTCDGTSI
jgi:hypothetical protein